LASNERAKREAEIKDRLLTLQRTEESLVELALESDFDVVRRPAAAPEDPNPPDASETSRVGPALSRVSCLIRRSPAARPRP
jgi:hypothetical protein